MHAMLDNIAQQVFGAFPVRIRSVAGGDINRAAQVVIKGTGYFVKYNPDSPAGFFQTEARGLNLLRSAAAIRVPEVVAYADARDGVPAYLVLEWLERAAPSRDFGDRFGRALARLHRVTADSYGLDHDNHIGKLPQSNTASLNWVEFYRDQRLAPQIRLARRNGVLPTNREVQLTQLLERLDDLLGNVERAPSLLHGDLWSGNFMVTAGDVPTLIDPAVYYGDREVELAFTELFGGFPTRFYAAYHEAYPLQSGYEGRRPLYQLYPLLVHLNLFGEIYGGAVDAICQRYL